MLSRNMPDPKDAIEARLKELGWTTYRLVKELKTAGKTIPVATVYDFMSGKSPINSVYVGLIMDVLGMEFTAKRKGK